MAKSSFLMACGLYAGCTSASMACLVPTRRRCSPSSMAFVLTLPPIACTVTTSFWIANFSVAGSTDSGPHEPQREKREVLACALCLPSPESRASCELQEAGATRARRPRESADSGSIAPSSATRLGKPSMFSNPDRGPLVLTPHLDANAYQLQTVYRVAKGPFFIWIGISGRAAI